MTGAAGRPERDLPGWSPEEIDGYLDLHYEQHKFLDGVTRQCPCGGTTVYLCECGAPLMVSIRPYTRCSYARRYAMGGEVPLPEIRGWLDLGGGAMPDE